MQTVSTVQDRFIRRTALSAAATLLLGCGVEAPNDTKSIAIHDTAMVAAGPSFGQDKTHAKDPCTPLAVKLSGGVPQRKLHYQTWGLGSNDQSWGIDVDSAGNLYMGSYIGESDFALAYRDIHMFRIDPFQNIDWQQSWQGPNAKDDKAFHTTVYEPYVYTAGTTNFELDPLILNTGDAVVLQRDIRTGQLVNPAFVWDQAGGYEEVDGLVVENDAVYISGWTRTSSAPQNMDIFVHKLNLDLTNAWPAPTVIGSTSIFGGPLWDEGNGQMAVVGDKVYVVGHWKATWVSGLITGGDAVLAAFDEATGVPLWQKTWSGPQGAGTSKFDNALGMAYSAFDDTLVVVGFTNTGTLSAGTADIFVLKYDLDGNLIWEQIWDDMDSNDKARTIFTADDGTIYVAGATETTPTAGFDMLLLKYSPDGNLLDSSTWPSSGTDSIHGGVLNGRCLYLVGETKTHNPGGVEDAILIRADAETLAFPAP